MSSEKTPDVDEWCVDNRVLARVYHIVVADAPRKSGCPRTLSQTADVLRVPHGTFPNDVDLCVKCVARGPNWLASTSAMPGIAGAEVPIEGPLPPETIGALRAAKTEIEIVGRDDEPEDDGAN